MPPAQASVASCLALHSRSIQAYASVVKVSAGVVEVMIEVQYTQKKKNKEKQGV